MRFGSAFGIVAALLSGAPAGAPGGNGEKDAPSVQVSSTTFM